MRGGKYMAAKATKKADTPKKRNPATRKYKAEELQAKIDEYFAMIEANNQDPDKEYIYATIESLQTFLDICPDTWNNYENYTPPNKDNNNPNSIYNYTEDEIDKINTSRIIKKTSRRILGQLMQEGMKDPKKAALIIYLSKQKAYGGYTDKQTVETSGDVQLNVTLKRPDGSEFNR